MAIHAPITGAPMRAPINLAPSERVRLETTIERLIGLLDLADGDPDLELNGDERDGSFSEEDFINWNWIGIFTLPGCPVGDPGGGDAADEETGEELLAMKPKYGVDQTAGPINEREAVRDHYRALAQAEARA